jgi:predicted metal-dependent phosphoesterase TrpH
LLIKCDLHLHSNLSPDCGMKLDTIIGTCLRRGIGCIALTDHNTLAATRELQRLAPFPVIAGEEIKTTHGEIIGLFISEEIPRGKSPGATAEEIHAQGGVVYVPHPFDRLRKSAITREALLEIVDMVDVIETHNSRIIFKADQEAAELFAAQHGKLRGGGSDAHVWWELGHSYVEMPEFEGADGFLSALALGMVRGRLSSPAVHLASTITKWRKKYLRMRK